MRSYFLKRFKIVSQLFLFSYDRVIHSNFWKFFWAVFYGGLIRCFSVLSFVLILQFLVLAVLPNSPKAEFVGKLVSDFLQKNNINIQITASMIVGALIFIIIGLNLICQYKYQNLVGLIIKSVNDDIASLFNNPKEDINERLKTTTTMTVSSIKIAEIIGFMSVLILVIGLISVPVLGICLLLCGLAVVALILISPRRLRMKKDISDSREAYQKDKSLENYDRFLETSELLRFRNQFSSALELSVVGIATVLFVIIIQLENIELSDVASYEILFLVFAIRYAFAYMRELSRNISQLLDLRTSFVN